MVPFSQIHPPCSNLTLTITNATAQNDLWIPITYNDFPEIATTSAQMANGTYLVNSWTHWRAPVIKDVAVSVVS